MLVTLGAYRDNQQKVVLAMSTYGRGMPISVGIWELGCPKRVHAHITLTAPLAMQVVDWG